MTTILVGCTKSKRETEEPIPAAELYDSVYFDKRWTYANLVDGDVYILSAKHGIVHPDEKLRPYDVSIYDLSAQERTDLSDSIDTSVLDDHIVVLAGRKYVEIVEQATDGATVEAPLDGGIGEQLSQLNDMIARVGGNDGE